MSYKIESLAKQEKITNPTAKNSVDNMSDDGTDAEGKKKKLAVLLNHLLIE